MNQQETTKFVQQVAIAFPGILELLEKSPSTLGVWGKTLEQVSYSEATNVLDRWIQGTLESPPVGFRRELFALDVRAVAMRRRSDLARNQEQQEQLEKLNRSKQPSAAFRSIAKPFHEILALRTKVMAGELSATECELKVHAIVEGAFT